MRIERVAQLPPRQLNSLEYDLVVVASGFEERAVRVAQLLKADTRRRVAIGFQSDSDLNQRKRNDELLARLRFDSRSLGGGDWQGARALFEELLRDQTTPMTTILIDISSMTRAWYGTFVSALRDLDSPERLRTIFTYVPAAFRRREAPYPANRVIAPLPGFSGLGLPVLPTALIIGLGDHHQRALALRREVDPGLTATYLAAPCGDKRFLAAVLRANPDLLASVSPRWQYKYPLFDFPTALRRLDDVASHLSKNWRVILAALGPKVFSLACFLVASHRQEISVWRASAGTDVPHDAAPPGRSVVAADLWWGPESR